MIIFGIHACKNAVKNRSQAISKIFLIKNKPIFDWLVSLNSKQIISLDEHTFAKMLPNNAVHQGVAMDIEEIQYHDISELKNSCENEIIAILDGITDPQNLGAIIRSAAAFGISGIILPEKSSCKITSTVVKTASGGLEHIAIYIVKNLSQAIEHIKNFGFWVYAFCESGEKTLCQTDLQGKICLILGAEGMGIRHLVKKNADFIIKIPTNNNFSTLNVAASAAIAFFEIAKQNNLLTL